MEFAGIGKRQERIQTPGYDRGTIRLKERGEGEGRGRVSCAESIIFISRGSVTSFPVLIPGEREAAASQPSTTPARESNPPRIDRFKMRELCVAVIPRCNDLGITSSRAALYALVVLSSHFRAVLGSVPGVDCAARLVVAHRLLAIRARKLETPSRYCIIISAGDNAAININ